MNRRPLQGNTLEYDIPPSPCETANDGLGCWMVATCARKKMACFDYYEYQHRDSGGGQRGTYYPEPRSTPTEEIYALMFTDGIKSKGVHITKRLHIERFNGIS